LPVIPEFFLDLFPSSAYPTEHTFSSRAWWILMKTLWQKRFWRLIELRPLANCQQWRLFVPQYVRQIRHLHPRCVETLDGPAIAQRLESAISLLFPYRRIHIGSLGLANFLYMLAEFLLSSLSPQGTDVTCAELAQPNSWTPTLVVNQVLAEIGEQMRHYPQLHAEAEVLNRRGVGQLLRQQPEHPIVKRFREFLRLHGHRSDNSYDLMAPCWREAPEIPFRRILGYANAPAASWSVLPPLSSSERRQWLEAAGGPLTRRGIFKLLRAVLDHLADYLVLREEQRYYFELHVEVIKSLVHRAGIALQHSYGVSEHSPHFLSFSDLIFALTRKAPSDHVIAQVTQNAALHAQNEALPPPPTFLRGDEPWADFDSAMGGWRGLGISRGRVIGPAVVIEDPRRLPPLTGKEILVVRGLDPGWTALFPAVAGIVMELGGMLSHGALAAREHGIPAVSGIEGVTRKITTGQLIEVDGHTGRVSLRQGH